MTDPIRIDIVSDVVCPWCLIGYLQLRKAARETDIAIEVHWHPFELNPQMVEEGENLREHLGAKYGITPEDSAKARDRLTKLGADLGFTFSYADDMRMVNTFRAHQLIDWAEDHDLAHDTKIALFEAFFARRENLNDTQRLGDIADQIGLDRAAAVEMLESGTQASIVRQKEHFWTSRGVTGVPAMIFERQHVVTGAQGEDNYARMLTHLTELRAA